MYIKNAVYKYHHHYHYLGSTVTSSGSLDAEVMQRFGKGTAAFGRLTKRLWQVHGIRLSTKIAVYRAVVLYTLLYCFETWNTYRGTSSSWSSFTNVVCPRSVTSSGRTGCPTSRS